MKFLIEYNDFMLNLWLKLAFQVCWERTSGKYLATAHEGEIKLWDIRKATIPALYINAHFSKIYSLDFSPHRADQVNAY